MKCQISLSHMLLLVLVLYCKTDRVANAEEATGKSGDNVCNTEICKQSAEILLESIDKTKNPCEDFYEFACGGYNAKNPLPKGKSSYGPFYELRDKALKHVKEILESPDENDIPEIQNAKLMYSHCMKAEDNVEVLKKELRKLSDWPILKDNKDIHQKGISLEEVLADNTFKGVNVIINGGVRADMKNAIVNVLSADQGDIPLGRENILDPIKYQDLVAAYRMFIATSASILGATNSQETEKQIDEMMELEGNLANLTSKPENRRNVTRLYNKMTIGKLQEITDNTEQLFNWTRYFNKLTGLDLNSSEPVIALEINYLKDALQLLNTTDRVTILNFIYWSIIKAYAWHAGGKLQEADLEFKKVLEGITEDEARWLQCSRKVYGVWGFAVGRPYVEKHFPEDHKNQAEAMIESVHVAFSERLKDVSFLDEQTRAVANEKSEAMRRLIGYPDWIHNDTAQQQYYEDYPKNVTSHHVINMIETSTGATIKHFKELRKPVDKNKFHMAPATVNAMYSSTANAITFPAAILQSPFYAPGRPMALNYGAIGYVVGHEITHGFDDKGSQFDKDGNFEKWWPDNVRQAFVNDTKCFIKQYNEYCPPELANTTKLCINGKSTQGENIADNGGDAQAFMAYNTWLQSNEDSHLPGMDEYTRNQIYFINSAHIWCGAATPEYLSQKLLYDSHSIGRYRVNGPMSNSKEFSEAFNCSPGSMNRDPQRCILW